MPRIRSYCERNKVEFCFTVTGLEHYSLVSLHTMQQGTIARLTDRGFGFISREGEEKDLFFHANELVDVEFNELREGDAVTFEVAEGPKGPNATKVQRA